ncbi:hypothetical protein AMATHDRAFT_134247 [Amanita thiersii Skay4041]|uniref:UBC core domain-containing protein n=1 Tax=Amanita thiersii Skay4041 TaxID=703135 RepID=A0A2A9P1N9_9AGAR|nr:hypothetical protein AMATHDRAFT_134247 [Amanita thiersii Skay4041]
MASISVRRLSKELSEIKSEGCPTGINLVKADDFEIWWFTIEVMGDSIYKEEIFTLQFRFDSGYPISAPAVQFVITDGKQAPIHPHIYSNGHICASILGNEWSPVLGVTSVCLTIQSMLASNKSILQRPTDNDRYVQHAPSNPKKV